jgi:lysyl-tRNA synthetase class 2
MKSHLNYFFDGGFPVTDSTSENPIENRKQKRNALEEEGVNPYPKKYDRTHTASEAIEAFDPEAEESSRVRVCGRIKAERLHGNAAFLDIEDASGTLQVYLSPSYLDQEELFEEFESRWDIGDFIGAEGELFETNEGEISVVVREGKLLAKGLRPLPEKFHGLKDRETRYRKRYLDLVSNESVRDNFKLRSRFLSELRRNLEERGYHEVETPMMQDLPGGAEAEPFVTHHDALDRDLFLRIAPELYLKRLLVGGFEKVFEINRNFRNEGISTRHNPEFTMLELYRAYVDYEDIMELTEDVLSSVFGDLVSTEITYDGQSIDLSPPWKRLELVDAVERETGLDLSLEQPSEEVLQSAREAGLDVEPKETTAKQILELFEETVEDQIVQPTFVTNFPSDVSPLAKDDPDRPGTSERFELFIGGLEVGNAYSELNDPVKQRENFENQADSEDEIDEDYLEALEHGMPPAGGLGLGIDRLVMLLTDSQSIREVILFPTLREKHE